jgi:hypothetical protein
VKIALASAQKEEEGLKFLTPTLALSGQLVLDVGYSGQSVGTSAIDPEVVSFSH